MYKRRTCKSYNRNEKKKEQYRNSSTQESLRMYRFLISGDESYFTSTDYPNMRNHCHRHFSTKQEKSLFDMHEYEYSIEYNLKLRRRRSSSNLIDAWDDLPAYTWDLEKSWKHSTKRRRQYCE